MSLGTIYGTKTAPRVLRTLGAAAYNGAKIDVVEYSPFNGDNQKPEYLEKFPHGKLPGFQGTDGTLLSETRAIARFVAGVSNNANLLGSDNKSAALIEQWISFADEEILNPGLALMFLFKGLMPYNKNAEEKHWTSLNRGFKTLESHLKKNTFVASHRVTLADLTLVSNIRFVYTSVAGEEFRSQYPNVTRYYQTVSNQPPVLDLFKGVEFAKENGKFVPPKKEEKPKKASAPQQPKAAPKPKKPESDDDDDDTPPPPKPVAHPCASLPPSPFNLEEAKRQYSNLDTPDFLKWFYEKFDKDGFSIWRFDFKYNDELTQVFMSANQIGGYFSRLEGSRKYVLGNGAVYGTNNDSLIAGVLICRGKDYKPITDVAPDTESYEISPIDVFNNADDKAFFEGNLTWEGSYKGKPLADAKTLK
ncbi:unnamed protein product [Sympodiomycopsis kandeliae]